MSRFESPEDCFKTFAAAKSGNDPAAVVPCLSEAMVNYHAGTIAVSLQRIGAITKIGEPADECSKVLAKHGLGNADMVSFLELVSDPAPGGIMHGQMQIGAIIKNKGAFFVESDTAMTAVIAKMKELGIEGADDLRGSFPPCKLVELRVTGDTAKGRMEFDDGHTESKPIFFKRENDSWVIAITEDEPDWTAPVNGQFQFRDFLKNQE